MFIRALTSLFRAVSLQLSCIRQIILTSLCRTGSVHCSCDHLFILTYFCSSGSVEHLQQVVYVFISSSSPLCVTGSVERLQQVVHVFISSPSPLSVLLVLCSVSTRSFTIRGRNSLSCMTSVVSLSRSPLPTLTKTSWKRIHDQYVHTYILGMGVRNRLLEYSSLQMNSVGGQANSSLHIHTNKVF